MKILVTGAGGFVGQQLAESLLNDGHDVTLTDIFEPPIPPSVKDKHKAKCIKADICDTPDAVLSSDLDAVYVLHSIMSSTSEAIFELGYRVNFHATFALLEAVRKICRPGISFIFASTFAVYGQPLPAVPNEDTVATPHGSYGTAKMMIEYAINDYTRRGFISGISLRLPAIANRPGKPNAHPAAWSSGIIREPLQGLETTVPCPDDYEIWICSPRSLIKNLIICLTLPKDCLPTHIRSVNMPGITVTVAEMIQALREVRGEGAVKLIKRTTGPPPSNPLVDSWPARVDISKALSIGLVPEQPFKTTVEDFAAVLAQ